ncbi:MAG TPA: hypothetical protein VKD67_03040 [Acidimicrobiales bacterium]|nr:hypothetical protein [Acidimicrobiales bacterium]
MRSLATENAVLVAVGPLDRRDLALGRSLAHSGIVTRLVGRLRLRRLWQRFLHDRSAERIVAAVANLERVRVDIVDVLV